MKEIKIVKTFDTLDELNNSKEYQDMWQGFSMKKEKNYPDLELVESFVTEEGDIYTIREITMGKEKGLRLLNKVSICSCINSSPFTIGKMKVDSLVIDNESHYSRSKENRIKLAELCRKDTKMFISTLF